MGRKFAFGFVLLFIVLGFLFFSIQDQGFFTRDSFDLKNSDKRFSVSAKLFRKLKFLVKLRASKTNSKNLSVSLRWADFGRRRAVGGGGGRAGGLLRRFLSQEFEPLNSQRI